MAITDRVRFNRVSTPWQPRRLPSFLTLLGAGTAGIVLARTVTQDVTLAIGAVLAAGVAALAYYRSNRVPALYLYAVAILLLGYAVLGRGFAYIGIPPLFIGELVLALGVVWVLLGGELRLAFRSPICWLITLFAAWGLACALPYLPQYGIDVFRDSVIWGYGVFAIVVSVALLRTGMVGWAVNQYGTWMPYLLIWTLLFILTRSLYFHAIPHVPGTTVDILGLKSGDAGVHLAGMGAFTLLGIDRLHHPPRRRAIIPRDWIFWPLWVAAVFAVGTQTRAGLLAAGVPVALLVVLQPFSHWWKPMIVATTVIGALSIANVNLAPQANRRMSIDQLVANMQSVFQESGSKLDGTKEWRLEWWRSIVDYTVFGEHFWTGKGYGVNLADDDGFQTGTAIPLRSPHNGHMTILARSGVPGFLIWAAFVVTFLSVMFRGFRHAKRNGHGWWAAVDLWIIAYFLSFVINGAFDVFLEGPQGGIWFWCIVGLGIAVTETQRRIGPVVHAPPSDPWGPRPQQRSERRASVSRYAHSAPRM